MSTSGHRRKVGPGFDETRFFALLDAVPARVAFIDRNRRHLYANREYAETMGMSADDFIGKSIADIFGEESYAKLKPFGDRALAGESLEWEGWIHTRASVTATHGASTAPTPSQTGR